MTSDDHAQTMVVGGGGLLGRAVRQTLARREWLPTVPSVDWANLDVGAAQLRAATRALGAREGWRMAWCAGAGIVGATPEVLERERSMLVAALEGLGEANTAGTIFFASSAGGVYAGSAGPPFTESHDPRPLAPYGEAKLLCEELVADYAAQAGSRALIGRIANLYGPGQNLDKPQGLISHMCMAAILGRPVSVYVSLDTIRDYIYVHDCAELVVDGLEAVESVGPGGRLVTTKILASHEATTIAALIGELRRVFKRRPQIVLGSSGNARFQVRDLRLRSTVLTALDHRTLTPLPAGIAATVQGLRRVHAEARV